MKRPIEALIAAFLVVALAPAAQAQGLVVPRTSPAEQVYSDINRSLQRQEQSTAIQQQSQFELNQLRWERDRIRNQPSLTTPRICAPGQIAC